MNTWKGKELKKNAKSRLRVNYWRAVAVGVLGVLLESWIYNLVQDPNPAISVEAANLGVSIARTSRSGFMMMGITAGLSLMTGAVVLALVNFFLLNPIVIGAKRYFSKGMTEENTSVKEICFVFDREYKNSVKIMFLRDLFTFLWSCLLIVPGVIKSYEYRMIPYILSEHPGIKREEAFALSRDLMRGNKWRAFLLDLSFLPWMILSIFTFGLLDIFFLTPYKEFTEAGLYMGLKRERMPVRKRVLV